MKKFTLKNIVLGLFVLLLLIQFIPGEVNNGAEYGTNDISMVVSVPDDVKQILHTSCNDCHSNATVYPWYSKVQPVRLWLDHHVEEGKAELNFSEFAMYKKKRQLHKLDEVAEMIEEKEMPLASYTFIHKNALLSPEQQTILINWSKQAKRELQDSGTHN